LTLVLAAAELRHAMETYNGHKTRAAAPKKN
jgi:hypothetical protein